MFLIPRDEKFFALFEEASQNIADAAKTLQAMLDGMADVVGDAARMKAHEERGDVITHEIFSRLHRTFVTPIDREDIHALATKLDDIVDMMEAASARLVLYHIPAVTPPARQFGGIIASQSEELKRAMECLTRKKHERISSHVIEIHRLENEGDRVLREALSGLFEGQPEPLALIKWKEIYETLETVTDRCEEAAVIVESVVLKLS